MSEVVAPPTVWSVLGRGLPGFLREGFLPLLGFYVCDVLWGLGAGMAAAAAVSVGIYAAERRAGRDGLLVRFSLGFVAVQTVVGLVSDSAVAYLATPVLANAAWGVAFLVSAVLRRPLAGALACAWFPFSPAFRRSAAFVRVYNVESVVWGVYLIARSALRLAALLSGAGLALFVVVTFLTGTPLMLVLLAWSVWFAVRRLADDRARRTGPLAGRLRVRLTRSLGVGAWALGERLGLDMIGATAGPVTHPDPARDCRFEELLADAEAGGGVVDTAACPYPVHELLGHLVERHRLLLHGSNRVGLERLEPHPARDWSTELRAVIACDDPVWPLFYAVVARGRVDGVFSACLHVGGRRRYVFALGGDPVAAASWTDGMVYAFPRDGFHRVWGREWASGAAVQPRFRIPVRTGDFPLREAVVSLSGADGVHAVRERLRAAKRAQAIRT
jgi:Protein of unknown function (DUF3159)